jgi:hypothetical protein
VIRKITIKSGLKEALDVIVATKPMIDGNCAMDEAHTGLAEWLEYQYRLFVADQATERRSWNIDDMAAEDYNLEWTINREIMGARHVIQVLATLVASANYEFEPCQKVRYQKYRQEHKIQGTKPARNHQKQKQRREPQLKDKVVIHTKQSVEKKDTRLYIDWVDLIETAGYIEAEARVAHDLTLLKQLAPVKDETINLGSVTIQATDSNMIKAINKI